MVVAVMRKVHDENQSASAAGVGRARKNPVCPMMPAAESP